MGVDDVVDAAKFVGEVADEADHRGREYVGSFDEHDDEVIFATEALGEGLAVDVIVAAALEELLGCEVKSDPRGKGEASQGEQCDGDDDCQAVLQYERGESVEHGVSPGK